MKQIVDKGEVRNPSANFELLDLHGNYEAKMNITTYGGHFQQLYYIVAAIMDLYEADLAKYYARRQAKPEEPNRATNPIELVLEQFFVPFLVNYLKEIKQESFTFMASAESLILLESFKIAVSANGFFELAKMTKEQYVRFRNLFVEERLNNAVYLKNTNSRAMELLLNTICMIICKKIPIEIPVSATLHTKVKLVAPKNDPKPEKAVVTLSIATQKAS